MFPRLRLKTKLVLAMTAMVVIVVATLSSIYISQLIRQRVDEAFENGEFISLQIFHSAREALEYDLANPRLKIRNEKDLKEAIEESLQTDAAVNSLLQSIIGYSPTIYDIAITDEKDVAILHTDSNLISKKVPERQELSDVRTGGAVKLFKVVYGEPRVFEIRLPMKRNDQPFATIRIGISSVLLKEDLQPKLNNALALSGISILIAMLIAAVLSNLALRPLESISRRLDEMSSAAGAVPHTEQEGDNKDRQTDEFGVVTTKIERLGQHMQDVKDVFSAMKENLEQIMANLQDGVMLFTRDEKAVLVSASVEHFLHKSREEMLGKTAEEIFAHLPRIGMPVLEAFRRHEPIGQMEVLGDGVFATGRGRVQLSLDFIEENGERIGALLTLRDAESVHRIEDELELSRRMAAVGRLTSGVAHEVKNPINAIVVHLEVLRQKLRELEPDTARHLDVIGSEIRRLDRVVQTLVDFTRPVDLNLTEIDIRRLLDDVIMLSTPDAEKHGVHVLRDISDDPLPVKIDADLVKQAVLNIVINGMQAMAAGGNLTISARRRAGEAEIEISDQGAGIPREIRDKIFNLYFTTKKGGSGIGLPMTYRVIQLHNGAVEVDTKEGVGTTFRLRLPLTEAREYFAHVTAAEGTTVEGR